MVRFRRGAPVCPAPAGSLSLRGMTSTWLNRQIIRLGPEHRPVKTGHWPPTSSMLCASATLPCHHESAHDNKRVQREAHIHSVFPQKRHHRLRPPPLSEVRGKHTQPGNDHHHHHFETQRTHRRIPTLHNKCPHQSPDLSPLMVSLGSPPPLAPRVEKHLQTPLKSTCFNVRRGPLRDITLCQMEHLRNLSILSKPAMMGASNDGSQESDLDIEHQNHQLHHHETGILQTLQTQFDNHTGNCHPSHLPRS